MKILAASHGTLASGIKSSLSILVGETNHVTVIDAFLDEESLEEKLQQYFQNIPEDEQVIMLSDLYGGSVNQSMYMYLQRPNTYLIAGFNLALVLELALQTEPLSFEMLQIIVEASRNAIKIVELDTPKTIEEDFLEE